MVFYVKQTNKNKIQNKRTFLARNDQGGIVVNREEANMIGFEIVAYAGEARTNLLEAINAARDGEYEKAEELIKEADESIKEAHNTQTQMLAQEAGGKL